MIAEYQCFRARENPEGWCYYTTTQDMIRCLPHATLEEIKAIAADNDLQKTVRVAAERWIRKLAAGKARRDSDPRVQAYLRKRAAKNSPSPSQGEGRGEGAPSCGGASVPASRSVRKVVCAAIRSASTGLVVAGARHYDAVMRNVMDHAGEFKLGRPYDQGFIDQHGVFMDRQEAWKVAEAAGQLRDYKSYTPGTLFSEDLY